MSKVKVLRIDARPTAILEAQYTVFWLDPRDRTCGVYTKRGSEGTTVSEHYNVVLSHALRFHPHEEALHDWFANNEDELGRVCDGHEVVWDGNNHRGVLNEEATSIWDMLVDDLNGYEDNPGNYEIWDVRDWMQFVDVRAETTDEELAELVDISTPLESDKEIVIGDILEHLQTVRADLRDYDGWTMDTWEEE